MRRIVAHVGNDKTNHPSLSSTPPVRYWLVGGAGGVGVRTCVCAQIHATISFVMQEIKESLLGGWHMGNVCIYCDCFGMPSQDRVGKVTNCWIKNFMEI